MRHTLDRIALLNPSVNAIVSLRPADELMAEARRADERRAAGTFAADARAAGHAPPGWLHGLPLAVKDLVDTADLRTTYGSPLFEHHVPAEDAPLVRRLRAAGAIVIGKTNTPEFGLGSQTYNPVHGITRNPYDLGRTAGGSSGGAAAALAARLVPLADGSDMMGSLRNPAAFCNVYGLRPSIGLVPGDPPPDARLPPLATDGPMARSVRDLARLLDTLSNDGAHLSTEGTTVAVGRRSANGRGATVERLPEFGRGPFATALEGVADGARALVGTRLGWLADLGGHYPTEPGILALCESALAELERLGATVEPLVPRTDPDALWRAWTVLRSAHVAARLGVHYADRSARAKLKPEAVWEIERGLSLSAADIGAATGVHACWRDETARLFERVDALVLPSAQCFPFDARTHWPTRIGERSMRTYHEWMAVVVPASLIGLPALALPAGFGEAGLPAGIQLIGRHGSDGGLLRLGEAYHRATDWPGRRPHLSGLRRGGARDRLYRGCGGDREDPHSSRAPGGHLRDLSPPPCRAPPQGPLFD